ncbi:MAG: triphosphoribosyl-dephospho-CoA synthase [Pseudolabrys sp.]
MSEPAPDAWQQRIAAAFVEACRDELAAPKPGNVHVFADGHRMTTADFELSAAAAAGPLTAAGARVGQRILGAVEATFAAVGSNTNLGIVLLCAPLAAAAEPAPHDLRTALVKVLGALDWEDAELAFRAIVRALPAGLGHAERFDVFAPATVSLREAMAEAAGRDRIALQYATGFADIFERGVPALAAGLAVSLDRRFAVLSAYLGFLAAFPDSHILRKHGAAAAEQVCRDAAQLGERVQTAHRLDDVLPAVLAWDAELKQAGINPGTSADLTVATLFAHRLRTILPTARNSD